MHNITFPAVRFSIVIKLMAQSLSLGLFSHDLKLFTLSKISKGKKFCFQLSIPAQFLNGQNRIIILIFVIVFLVWAVNLSLALFVSYLEHTNKNYHFLSRCVFLGANQGFQ